MKHIKRLTAILLSVMFIAACFSFTTQATAANQTDDDYYVYLKSIGFPDSYATLLADLHVSRPNWTFEPVLVTKLKSSYTWSYVISKETEDESNNLIDNTSSYAAYHKSSSNVYDSGKAPCSLATVRYFMDPRNFMTEDRIFMFQDLSYVPGTYSVGVIDSVFAGTFMENAVIPDPGNTLTYAQYLLQVGEKYDVSPTFLAARLRQEKGTNGNTKPLLNGSCGNTLWSYYNNGTNGAPSSGYSYSYFMKFNGYYNYFNIDAMGDGYFNIYHNAMKEAYNASWDTHMEAIDGGAAKVKSKYIDDYQNTSYFQKFNVDPRSGRNFWGQYMQTIYAVTSEGKTVYRASTEHGLLDRPFNFIIPVFDGMSSSPYPNPGSYFGITYSYMNMLDFQDGVNPNNRPLWAQEVMDLGDSYHLYVQGWSAHTSARSGFQYSVDGGAWKNLSASYREDVANANTALNNSPYNAFADNIDMSPYGLGTHVVRIRGAVSGGTAYPIASIKVTCSAEDLDIESTNSSHVISQTENGNTIKGISKNTPVESLLADLSDGCKIVDAQGNPVPVGLLKTGDVVQYIKFNTVVDSAIIIVTGDVTCDGTVGAKDLIRAKKMATGNTSGYYIEAVDLNGDNNVTAEDIKAVATIIAGN